MSERVVLARRTPEEIQRSPREAVSQDTLAKAAIIVDEIAREGEPALRRYAERFDGLAAGAPLVLGPDALREAFDALDAGTQALLERVGNRIRDFARAQRESLTELELSANGAAMGHRVHAVPSAGCYAPGGRFPLPSTVLMTAITAHEAGVERVVVASPRPAAVTLAAAHVADADGVLVAGGAQAIAALAYGAGEIGACEVIVGPGNEWVTAAKQLVAGRVRIDSLAGPSELLVVADASTDPALVAADLLAQAEHDPLAEPSLIALDDGVIEAVESELTTQLETLVTRETASVALRNGFAVRATSADEAIELCDRLAPEHLQWMVPGEDEALKRLQHYGGLFLGSGAAEVLGDYGAGPNHVLPTGGSARAKGGLSVLDFLKVQTWLRVDDPRRASGLAEDAAALARLEGLSGHARAAEQRVKG